MSSTAQMVCYVTVSLLSASFLVSRYRKALPGQRWQIAVATAAAFALMAALILVSRLR